MSCACACAPSLGDVGWSAGLVRASARADAHGDAMTDLKTLTLALPVCLAATSLVACGDSGNQPTSGDTQSQTETFPQTGSDPSGDPSGDPSSSPTESQDTGGTMGATSESSPTTGETTDTTGIDVTNTDTGTPTSETEPATSEPMTTEPQPVCGNGMQEGNEECDDGNQDPGDGCEPNCVISAVCGNGTVEAGEVCDDGNTDDGDECSADCQVATPPQVCGDGTVQDPEVCDDGNTDNGDGCEADCTPTPAECGNGVLEMGEQCDDGNQVDGGPNDFCKNDCTVFVPPQCQAPADYVVCDENINLADKADKTNALKAMGICNDQPSNSVVVTNYSFDSPTNAAWQVAKGFGSYTYDHDMDPATPNQLLYSPREGGSFLMISTGNIKAPNNQGIVVENANSQGGNGDNGNPDAPDTLPLPLHQQVGSNNGAGGTPFIGCDGTNDCSDTLAPQWQIANNPNDKLFFKFNMKVPEGTFGYTFDFVFCSSEWPTYVNTSFNDLLIVWQRDPSPDNPNADPPVDPYTGNVTFIPNPNDPTKGLPLTITALDPYYDGPGYTFNEPQLTGTGFETRACSDWFTAKGGVQPGADVEIGFFLADMGDSILATAALIDNFRWDCEGCVPSEVDDCGVQEPQ
ncbi:MAG: DUF4215 domain-containing protein [Myxococcales bacterium]|nr:DUF4215 domain-containing protein [Myxococcales bacterium]